jgi:hypothetical protein
LFYLLSRLYLTELGSIFISILEEDSSNVFIWKFSELNLLRFLPPLLLPLLQLLPKEEAKFEVMFEPLIKPFLYKR